MEPVFISSKPTWMHTTVCVKSCYKLVFSFFFVFCAFCPKNKHFEHLKHFLSCDDYTCSHTTVMFVTPWNHTLHTQIWCTSFLFMHNALSLIWCPDVRKNEQSLVSTALFNRVACNIFYNQQMAQLSDTSTSCQHNVDAVRGTCYSPRGVIKDVWHWDSEACFISAKASRLTVPGLMSDLCNHMTDDAKATKHQRWRDWFKYLVLFHLSGDVKWMISVPFLLHLQQP